MYFQERKVFRNNQDHYNSITKDFSGRIRSNNLNSTSNINGACGNFKLDGRHQVQLHVKITIKN